MKSSDRVSLWIHQSNLLWSRLQTISAIQVGTFAGWYFLREKEPCLSNSLLILTTILLVLFVPIFYRDIYYLKRFSIEAEKNKTGIKKIIRGRHVPYLLLLILGVSNVLLIFQETQPQELKPPHNITAPNQHIQDQQEPFPKMQEPPPTPQEPTQPTKPE